MVNTILEVLFWVFATLIVWTQIGYATALAILVRLFARPPTPARTAALPPGMGARPLRPPRRCPRCR